MWRFEAERIHIENLRVDCIIGVNPDERERIQPLLITLSFPADFGLAEAGDDLSGTVDYSRVAHEARAFVRAGEFGLLETLIRRLGAHLCERFGLDEMRLHVRKPEAVAGSDGPGVSLTVRREGA